MERKRISLLSCLILLVLLLGAGLFFASQYMLSYSLQPTCEAYDEESTLIKKAKEYPWQKDWIDSLRECRGLHELRIISQQNGTALHAIYMPAVVPNSKTALLVHGYGCYSLDMIHIAYIYHHVLGMNVLMPDLYGHGESMGDHVNMGWLDRIDVLQWVTVADSLYGGNTQMVMHGISMGGATVMMASGEQVPACVRAYVDDCGYTSVWDEFAGELRARFSLPTFPLMYTTSWLCRQRYGWDFREANSMKQLAHCRLPMLFIHGDKDTFVPTRMVYELYRCKPQPKRIWISKGSKHAQSYSDHPEEYTKQVTSFVKDYLPN